jgi:hypothetical protein
MNSGLQVRALAGANPGLQGSYKEFPARKSLNLGPLLALISQKMKSADNLTLTQSNAAALEEHWRGNRESPPLPIIAWTRRATGPKHCFLLSYH